MNLKNIKIFLFLTLVLVFSACSSKEYIKIPCEYPKLALINSLDKVKIIGYNDCMVKESNKLIHIGRCLDQKNFSKLNTKIKNQKLIIKAYENKIKAYNATYAIGDINEHN